MNLSSPTSSSASTSSSSSSTSNSTLHPNHGLSAASRRRSLDTGGLHLALNDHSGSGSGRGYGGWLADPMQALQGSIDIAELVLAMREQTHSTIDQAYPATSTTFRPSSELEAQREDLIGRLTTWHFDASHLPPDEVLMCTTLLFESLWCIDGMEHNISLAFESIPPFLARISKIYREQTSYHNFQHALDVLQAVYCYLYEAGCVPSVEILREQEDDVFTSFVQTDAGKGKARAPLAPDTTLPTPRRRKIWRKSRSGGDTVLKRALRNQDLFALYVAAIGHDIGHPGLSNEFMKNAKTPLATLFDETSVLEKMHCTLLLQVMRKHRMGHLLDRLPSRLPHETRFSPHPQSRARTESDPGVRNIDAVHGAETDLDRPATPPTPLPPRPTLKKSASAYPGPSDGASSGTGTEFRNLLMKTILATDMSVHFKWMPKLEELRRKIELDADSEDEAGNVAEEVDPQTRLLLCQALIKCADISNPSRPPPVCKHWSRSLLTEWTEQALLEEQLALPISITASDDPMAEAIGQMKFIRMFTLPLLVTTSEVIPEMEKFAKQCDDNVVMWGNRLRDLKSRAVNDDGRPPDQSLAISDSSTSSSPMALPTSPPDVSTMFALSLPAVLYTPISESRQPPWTLSDPSGSPLLMTTRPGMDDSAHAEERVNGQTHFDSIPPSPPSSAATHSSHHRHTSHTQLPQVSIPDAASGSISSSNSQHAKSSSTTSASASSPLFSPHSIPTSSSSPRSEVSSSGSAVTSALGLQYRPGLRAAYDAHNGRSKSIARLENRTSWQGSITVTTATAASARSDSGMGHSAVPMDEDQISHGS